MTRSTPDSDEAAWQRLMSIRQSIDNIDAALVHLLAERFKFTQTVGELKAAHGLPAADPERERTQIARLRELAAESNLDPEFAEKWFNFVVTEVIRHHIQAGADGAERTGE
ncbi:chorismate mutase [Gryllotalpicola ginsengisoli]|uniref:chorismate mutase n=1 Tax=Gryllotalpicola ginsengisoli TaxID=444608 RepID=UPI0003B7A803|nr:chorismate mutase [Gryllotalpicola ginsengisoli]